MSTTIDQKVVEMRFDNKNFEANVSTTMSSLDKLKAKLRLEGATDGLSNVASAAKKVDVSPIGAAVDSIGQKFSAMEVIGVTALVNITNSALNAGKRMMSALTIDPIKTGFQEYETQINAVQTILANTQSKGSTIDDVNAALDELNTYADKTIYNFTEMTRNIGTFTAAGVDLDKSVSSIKGIANLAAVSGSTSQQASTAMYQLSQALAAGKVQLMDWNSVVNAGMGGQLFQDALKRTATQMGTNVDALIEKYGSFRESLTQGNWLTAEVLTETLTQLSGAYSEADLIAQGYSKEQAKEITALAQTAVDAATKVKTFTQLWDTLKEAAQSGWTQTWELIVGDFEQSKEFLTNLSDLFGGIIQASSDARNNLLKGALTSKWSQMVDIIEQAGIKTQDFNAELEKTITENGGNVDKLIEEYGSLEKAFSKGAASSDLITKTLERMSNSASGVSGSTKDMTGKLEEFQKVVNQVWNGDYKNGEERVKALTDAGYDYAQVQDLVNKTVDGQKLALEDLSSAQLKNIGYTDEQIASIKDLAKQAKKAGTPLNDLIENMTQPSGRELLLEGVMNIINGIVKALGAVKAAWDEVFSVTSKQVYNLIKAFNEMSKKFKVSDDAAEKITRTFKGLFSIVQMVASIVGGAFNLAFRAVTTVLGSFHIDILGITARMGDAIVKFRDFVVENELVEKAVSKVITWLKKAIDTLKQWFETFSELPIVRESVEKLQDLFFRFSENLQGFFGDGIKIVSDFIAQMKQMDGLTLDNLLNVVYQFRDNAIKYFVDFGGVTKDVQKSFKNFQTTFKPNAIKEFNKYIGWTSDGLGNVIEKITDFAVSLKTKFNENVGLGEVMAFTFGVGVIATAKRIGDTLSILAGPVKEVTNVLKGVTGVLSGAKTVLLSTSNLIDTYTKSIKVQTIYTIAKAIALLAGSVAALALLPQEKVWSSVGALTALSLVLVGLSFAMGKLMAVGGIGDAKGSLSLVGMAAAIIILVTAFKNLDAIDGDNILRNLAILAALAAGLSTMAIVLGRFGGKMDKDFMMGAIGMIGMAYAVKLLVSALSDLTAINQNVGSSLTILIGLMAALRILAGSAKKVGIGSALAFGTIAIAMKVLIGVMKDIMDLDIGKLRSSMGSFVIVIGIVSTLMLACRLAGKNAAAAGVGLLAISSSLILLTLAIKLMAGVGAGDLKKATSTISQLLIVFGAVVVLSKFAGEHAVKAGVMLLAMAGALFVIAAVLVVLSHIKPDGLKTALDAVTQLMLVFAVVIAASYLAKNAQGTMIAIVVAVGLLTVALAALSFVDSENLRNATACLTLVMAALALVVASTKLMNSSFAPLIVMTAAVAAIGGILILLANFTDPNAALASAAALSLVLTALSVSMVLINNFGKMSADTYASIGMMILALIGIAGVLAALTALDVAPSIETAESLSLLLIAMAAVTVILGKLGNGSIAGAAQGAAALDVVIAIVGGLIVGLGALVTYFPQVEEFLDRGLPLLEKIGTGLGTFFGSIIDGFMTAAVSGLPDIGTTLSLFMTNLDPFIAGVKQIDDKAIAGVSALAQCFLALTGSNLINTITSFLPGSKSMGEFTKELIPFAENVVAYAQTLSQVNPVLLMTAATSGKLIGEMLSMVPADGGLMDLFTGSNGLSSITETLPKFGTALSEFSTNASNVNLEKVQIAAEAGKAIADMASALPNSGGLLGGILGENDMSQFQKDLPSFGAALNDFSKNVENVNVDKVTAAAEAGKTVAEMASALPNSGGVIGEWFGENDMSQFSKQLPEFGMALAGFAKNTEGIKADSIETAKAAGEVVTSLANSIPNSGGKLAEWFGDNDMAAFGKSLESFGISFALYSEFMGYINENVVTATSAAAQSIIELDDAVPKKGGLFSGKQNLDDFGTILVSFAEKFSEYYTKISSINLDTLSGSTSELRNLMYVARDVSATNYEGFGGFAESLKKIAKAGIDGFIEKFQNATDRVRSACGAMIAAAIEGTSSQTEPLVNSFSSIMTNAIGGINVKREDFMASGVNVMLSFINGVRNQDPSARASFQIVIRNCLNEIVRMYATFMNSGVTTIANYTSGVNGFAWTAINAFSQLIGSCLETIRNSYGSFSDAGGYLVEGFADGITSKTYLAEARARAMASAAATAARKELDINSPSKVGYEIGGFFGLGFVNAVNDYGEKSYKAGGKVASMAKEGLTEAVSMISDYIGSGIDAQPRIRPVIDLTDVGKGIGRIDSMLSRSSAISIRNSMSKPVDTPNQNGSSQPAIGATYNFTQNNYSPKALSRIDIYRQTRNQISAMERKVKR